MVTSLPNNFHPLDIKEISWGVVFKDKECNFWRKLPMPKPAKLNPGPVFEYFGQRGITLRGKSEFITLTTT
jgi:hypothetical protein